MLGLNFGFQNRNNCAAVGCLDICQSVDTQRGKVEKSLILDPYDATLTAAHNI